MANSAMQESASLIHVLTEWSQLIFPILGGIGLVFTWAWKRMQRSVDKLEVALEQHALRNEENFDRLFTDQRKTSEDLAHLLGEHYTRHLGGGK